MKRFALLILLPVLLLPVLLLAACTETYEFHYRRTVVVQTPNGEVRASTVLTYKYEWYSGPTLPDSPRGQITSTGEATVVDLSDGRYLFVLLGNEGKQLNLAHREAIDAALKGGYDSQSRRMIRIKTLEQQRTPRPVPPEDYPLLVTFGDLSDPSLVMRVDPADLAATFGAGFALREITLEVTDDAVTEGVVEGVLGWWREYFDKGYTMNGEKRDAYGVNDPLADLMTAGVFKTRSSK